MTYCIRASTTFVISIAVFQNQEFQIWQLANEMN